jgi:hypothetical protein
MKAAEEEEGGGSPEEETAAAKEEEETEAEARGILHQKSACVFFDKRWVEGTGKVWENKTITNKVMKFSIVIKK